MSLLKGVLGAFVEFDETSEEKEAPAVKTNAFNGVPNTQTPGTTYTAPAVPAAQSVNQEYVDAIEGIVNNRKTPYTTFVETSKKLEAIIPDETTRLKAAFVSISGEGRSLDTILQAIDIHISDISGEVMRFARTSETQIQQQVVLVKNNAEAKRAENQALSTQISNLQQQISALTDKIAANTNEANTLDAEAATAEVKIHTVENAFKSTADFVVNKLTSRKAMLSALLTATK